MDLITINLFYIFLFATVILLAAEILRRKYRKQVVGKVKVVMIPNVGQVMTALCKYEDDTVTVAWDGVHILEGSIYKDTDLNEKKKTYECKEGDTVSSLWPFTSGFMKFLSVPCDMVIYREDDLVPLTRNEEQEIRCECGIIQEVTCECGTKVKAPLREAQIITPYRLWQKLNAQYRSVRNIQSEKSEKDKQIALDAMAKMIHPYVVYGALLFSLVCLILFLYLHFGVSENIEQIQYGLGQ